MLKRSLFIIMINVSIYYHLQCQILTKRLWNIAVSI